MFSEEFMKFLMEYQKDDNTTSFLEEQQQKKEADFSVEVFAKRSPITIPIYFME